LISLAFLTRAASAPPGRPPGTPLGGIVEPRSAAGSAIGFRPPVWSVLLWLPVSWTGI